MTSTALAIRHVRFEDLGILAPLLAQRSYRMSYLDAGIDPLTDDALLESDLVVVLGGPVGVYQTAAYPFLEAEKRAIARRLEAGSPTLGICLGAQLIADALGAEVAATGRTEIGYAPLTLTPQGQESVLAPVDGVPVLHWHGDQFAIPEGAVGLAGTPGFPHQAFASGANVLGLQFHLEADHTHLEPWLIGHAHELASAGIDPRTLRADAASHGPALRHAATAVFATWLDGLDRQQ
ncbi:MAG: glutamine amidotransferase [Propionicimonas sp.]|uniref:glutamine amidotransferase n=1 Tax=Propionicimonas sp. TaxID=1955623 RepID=UPI002B1EB2E4|nr:glutamine amidotransferase [Propionicimonas sp.]MEA4945206.1 glutamine amidotransferase [Propionicimonas sp.]MEA5055870.1 glutamine amidotransferase [Propionicimonas sp.]